MISDAKAKKESYNKKKKSVREEEFAIIKTVLYFV